MAQGSSLDGLSVASTTMDLDNDDFDKHRVKVNVPKETERRESVENEEFDRHGVSVTIEKQKEKEEMDDGNYERHGVSVKVEKQKEKEEMDDGNYERHGVSVKVEKQKEKEEMDDGNYERHGVSVKVAPKSRRKSMENEDYAHHGVKVTVGGSAKVSPPVFEGPFVHVVSQLSGLSLELRGQDAGLDAEGKPKPRKLGLGHKVEGKPSQLWRLAKSNRDDGMALLQCAAHAGLVLEVRGAAKKKSYVQANAVEGDGDFGGQLWALNSSGELDCGIRGLMLTIKRGKKTVGAELWVNKRKNSNAQKWRFEESKIQP